MHGIGNACLTIFSQDSVVLKGAHSYYAEYLNAAGTIYLTEYLSTRERFFEWKPNVVAVRNVSDWSLVCTMERGTHSSPNLTGNRPKYIKINLNDVRGFHLSRDLDKLKIVGDHDDSLCDVSFEKAKCDMLYLIMKALFVTETSSKDKHHHVVVEVFKEGHDLYRALIELEMFLDCDSNELFWRFITSFQRKTVDTLAEMFAKLDIVLEDDTPQFHTEVPCQPLSYDEFRRTLMSEEIMKRRLLEAGSEPTSRPFLWKCLLGMDRWNRVQYELKYKQASNEKIYMVMKQQWSTMTEIQIKNFKELERRMDLISREIRRVKSPWLSQSPLARKQLRNVLITFVMHNFDLGYVQGMADLAIPFQRTMANESDQFWSFVSFIDKHMDNFRMDATDLKNQLIHLYGILKVLDPLFAEYLRARDCQHMFFCVRWMWLFFTQEFPADDVLRLWEVLFLDKPCPNFRLMIAVAILQTQKKFVMDSNMGFVEMLKHFNGLQLRAEDVINKARLLYFTLVEKRGSEKVVTLLNMPLFESPAASHDDSSDSIERDLMASHAEKKSHTVSE